MKHRETFRELASAHFRALDEALDLAQLQAALCRVNRAVFVQLMTAENRKRGRKEIGRAHV